MKRWAVDAGFDRAGIATLEPSENGAVLRRWLARGEHAGMEWIGRRIAVREDPARLLPGACSVLCVALQYHPLSGEEEPQGDLWPRVARYARGRDYHDVMGRRLRTLAAKIRDAFPGCETRPYVDTGPLLERELAARAGLGAVAKNTHLLDRRGGSYFFLGELLLTLDLEPDEPVADLCGRCTRCLDACPTGALPEPYRLDSNRCISYWTIEHRGDLPPAAREMVGDWVFGCDVCQEVCPFNQRPPAGSEPLLRLPDKRRELDLAGLLALERDGYVERFQVSPMKRAKLEGLRRNAAVAMGNRRDPAYVPALCDALAGGPPVVRRHAAWALGRIAAAGADDGAARRALLGARAPGQDTGVRREIEAALVAAEG
ncbi:MAG: tRNA epoxyqueuosine(34) reductase QueG [Thermoanaerobaculia bacterium]